FSLPVLSEASSHLPFSNIALSARRLLELPFSTPFLRSALTSQNCLIVCSVWASLTCVTV
ncbi:unnamed protein product, partial [Closterium sp. Naga37s-1]